MEKRRKTRIYRSNKRENFTIINNEILRRKDVSWKAKGILTYIMALPSDWEIYLEELQKHATDGRDSFRSGWKELEKAGYAIRYPVKEKGKIIEWRTEVRETLDTATFSPQTDFPQVGKPQMEKPLMENPKLLSTYSTKDLTKQSTNNTNVDNKLSESVLESGFEALWKEYPNKKGKQQALKSYKKAIKDGVTDSEIKQGIEAYNQEIDFKRTEKRFIKHGSTWFSNKGWEDEYDTGKQVDREPDMDWLSTDNIFG